MSLRHSRAGGNPEIKSGFRSSIRRSFQARFHFLICFSDREGHVFVLFEVGAIHESPLLAGRYTQGCLISPFWIPACAGMT